MEHSAYIEIQKSTADVSAINKHKRMTFTGALSNLGRAQISSPYLLTNIIYVCF